MMKTTIVIAFFCLAACVHGKANEKRHEEDEDCPEKECEKRPLEISFVVDASASIWPANFTKGLWFVQNFIDKFNIGPEAVRVSMVTYGDRVYTEDAFNFGDYTDKEELNDAIDAIPYRHGLSTETGAAINYMLDDQLPHARPDVRKVIIVLTDGNSQRPAVTKAAADRAREEGLEVFVIGVGHDVSETELDNIASDKDHVFVVDSYHMLDDIIDSLHFETCGSTTPKAEKVERRCDYDPTDLVFIIDSSQSIGQNNFTDGLEFIREFLDSFEISPDHMRVAAVMFGDRVYGESAIPFDAYDDKEETLDAILALEWQHGTRTETGAGIDYMIEHFLPNTRSHAAHVGIVITDGRSQNWRKTEEEAAKARADGVVMFAVGVGKVGPGGTLDENELNNIAGDPSRVLIADDYAKLDSIKIELTHLTCHGISESLNAKQAEGTEEESEEETESEEEE